MPTAAQARSTHTIAKIYTGTEQGSSYRPTFIHGSFTLICHVNQRALFSICCVFRCTSYLYDSHTTRTMIPVTMQIQQVSFLSFKIVNIVLLPSFLN